MKRAVFGGVMFVLGLGPVAWLPAVGVAATEKPAARPFTVCVDPPVELMSVLFRLAGDPEYNQGRVPSYVQDVESHFGRFRDHPVVKLARELRQTRGISFNAPMGLAVHAGGPSRSRRAPASRSLCTPRSPCRGRGSIPCRFRRKAR